MSYPFSFDVPSAFRFTSDGCPRCWKGFNLPDSVKDHNTDHIALNYRCAECGHHWHTSWDRGLAKSHAVESLADLVEAGLSVIGRRVSQS